MQADDEQLKILATTIKKSLNIIYGQDMAFFLAITRFNDTCGIIDHIGNVDKDGAIDWLKEIISRSEALESTYPYEGHA